jgi:hypothetical protein
MRLTLGSLSGIVVVGLTGCPADTRDGDQSSFGSISTTAGPTSGATTGLTTAATGDSGDVDSGPTSTGPASTTANPTTGEDPKFDVGTDKDIMPPSGGQGCEKIDFLFVVDNSGSMSEEQQSLTNSFPGFISEIQNTVMAQDYHIMVIDTDASAGGGCFQSTCCNVDCNTWCQQCLNLGCSCQCNNSACPMPPTGECDTELGGGKVADPGGNACGVQGMNRYMVDGQPNLSPTFECLATVGTGGDGNERPMEAMLRSVTDLNAMGECNEGFVRDDAILVVTFITDEEDAGKSQGNPTTWKQDLVTLKNGDEDAIVMLGLIGDPDVPNGVCTTMGDAQASPNLRTFADSFTYGSWGSICSLDYTPFFHDAVSVIDTACDLFEPPG